MPLVSGHGCALRGIMGGATLLLQVGLSQERRVVRAFDSRSWRSRDSAVI